MTQPIEDTVWDEGLQPERTTLAWQRLAITLFGIALAIPKLTRPVIGDWSAIPTLIVAAIATTLFSTSHARYRRLHGHLTAGNDDLPHDGRLPLLTAATALLLAVIGLTVIASHFHP